MVISIWPSRPTMREKAPLTGRTESRVFERRATTYKKYRMLITGQVRGDCLPGLRFVPELSARTKIPPDASYSLTTKSFPAQENLSTRNEARGAGVCAGSFTETEFAARVVLVPDVYSFRSAGLRF